MSSDDGSGKNLDIRSNTGGEMLSKGISRGRPGAEDSTGGSSFSALPPPSSGIYGSSMTVVHGGSQSGKHRDIYSLSSHSRQSSPSRFDPEDFLSTPGSTGGHGVGDFKSGGAVATQRTSETEEFVSEQDGLLEHGSSVSGKHNSHSHHHAKDMATKGGTTLTKRSGSIKESHIMAFKTHSPYSGDTDEIIVMDKALAKSINSIKSSICGSFEVPRLSQIHIVIAQLWHYILQWMNIVDFIAIIPFFLQISGDSANGSTLSIVRVLRLARILRVLKLGKGSKGLQVLLATMVSSLPALVILGFFSMIGFILLGSLEYFFEGGNFKVTSEYPDGAYMIPDVTGTFEVRSKYDSIPMSMYWSIITSTGVGFGDIYPVTYYGRGVAVLAMYGGILVLALPISVIGNNFERLYDQSLGHLSYGVVNAILELMEDEDHEEQYTESREAYYDMALHDHALMGDAGVSDEGVFQSRRELLEKRASKLASVFVIAQVCLKEEADDINRLLVKVGLRDMISALEYVYDLDFRHQQLEDFVLHAVTEKQCAESLDEP